MIRGTFGPGTIVLGGFALLMLGFLGVGLALSTEWEASAEITVETTPDEVMALIDSPEGWRRWTTWPDSGLTRSGPPRGVGAGIAWNDPELGSGAFTITAVEQAVSIEYSVDVAGVGGDMSTRGRIALDDTAEGTLVRWHERGDLGGNPLMGYWARSMPRVQSAEMQKGLERLTAALDSLR